MPSFLFIGKILHNTRIFSSVWLQITASLAAKPLLQQKQTHGFRPSKGQTTPVKLNNLPVEKIMILRRINHSPDKRKMNNNSEVRLWRKLSTFSNGLVSYQPRPDPLKGELTQRPCFLIYHWFSHYLLGCQRPRLFTFVHGPAHLSFHLPFVSPIYGPITYAHILCDSRQILTFKHLNSLCNFSSTGAYFYHIQNWKLSVFYQFYLFWTS